MSIDRFCEVFVGFQTEIFGVGLSSFSANYCGSILKICRTLQYSQIFSRKKKKNSYDNERFINAVYRINFIHFIRFINLIHSFVSH